VPKKGKWSAGRYIFDIDRISIDVVMMEFADQGKSF
jgi:hypothetical protein